MARRKLTGSSSTSKTGSSHHAVTPAWCSPYVPASPSTTPTATSQSSPMTKSYQKAANARSLDIVLP